jgi:hypothetical protein
MIGFGGGGAAAWRGLPRPSGDLRGGEKGDRRNLGVREADDVPDGGGGGGGGLRPLTDVIHADSLRAQDVGGTDSGESTEGRRSPELPRCCGVGGTLSG